MGGFIIAASPTCPPDLGESSRHDWLTHLSNTNNHSCVQPHKVTIHSVTLRHVTDMDRVSHRITHKPQTGRVWRQQTNHIWHTETRVYVKMNKLIGILCCTLQNHQGFTEEHWFGLSSHLKPDNYFMQCNFCIIRVRVGEPSNDSSGTLAVVCNTFTGRYNLK